jgi:outer membrane receptor protein involved in Fe transport
VAEAQAAEEIPTVVVTGTRSERRLAEAPVATEVISRREIEASGARTVGDLLEKHPGLEVLRTFGGQQLRIQGLDPEYVLVLIDGQRAIGRIGGGIDLARFPVGAVERIEIVKGASSALYGSDRDGRRREHRHEEGEHAVRGGGARRQRQLGNQFGMAAVPARPLRNLKVPQLILEKCVEINRL